MEGYHEPVLLNTAVELLVDRTGGIYLDMTFGGGGHSEKILSVLGDEGRLVAFDKDLAAFGNVIDDRRFEFVRSDYRFIEAKLDELGIEEVDGILADLGVSSHQFDEADRGFSLRLDGELDMRMDEEQRLSAAEVVNEYEENELWRLFREYGEVRSPGKVVRAIVGARKFGGIKTTGELVEVLMPVLPKGREKKELAKVFQAIRIEVNEELEGLKELLEGGLRKLRKGGRFIVISYHSLEDRLVKCYFRAGNFTGYVEKDFYGNQLSPWELISRKAIVPTEEEIKRNPRARSAKLRAAKKK